MQVGARWLRVSMGAAGLLVGLFSGQLALAWEPVVWSPVAWSPFASGPAPIEVTLSAGELSHMHINAGWAKGDDRTLLFEVRNELDGPIQCTNALVTLTDGKNLAKTFMPKLFVPPGLTRNASLPNVQKGTMKSYAIQCTCFKKNGKGPCINPLRQS